MRFLWFAGLVLVAPTLWSMDIYRSLDADGNPIYSDRPQGPDAQPVSLVAPRPASPPASSAPPAGRSQPPVDAAQPALGAEIEREPTGEERALACEAARERLQLYMNARRLFRNLPNGEREYLDAEAMEQARAEAAADVATWCG